MLLHIGEVADRAQKMLVDGVVMIHIELHQRDNLAEVGHEAPKNPRLVHQPQHDLRRVARGQNVGKKSIGFGIGAQFGVDALQRQGDEPRRVGVDRESIAIRHPEQLDDIDRIALEISVSATVTRPFSIAKSPVVITDG